MKANAAQIINALIGLVSPIYSLLLKSYTGESRSIWVTGKRKMCCNATALWNLRPASRH